MGLYVATLAWMAANNGVSGVHTPARKLCLSIDVQHGAIFVAPGSVAKRTKALQSACHMIAALWPTL